ncbi:hypothetical protein ASG68_24460 [Rhizobium sp. Leaf453]|nr:hypothetical protein ASG42_28670 [Rhizobium sp. Leaf391]KQU05917.1 hypothetical protein ASG68_24460 [Rhizobium sp. Leaf453]
MRTMLYGATQNVEGQSNFCLNDAVLTMDFDGDRVRRAYGKEIRSQVAYRITRMLHRLIQVIKLKLLFWAGCRFFLRRPEIKDRHRTSSVRPIKSVLHSTLTL